MPKNEGKTINELLRVDDITGTEILPMSVYDEELNAYVTRGITLDNFFKTIYGMIQDANANISYVREDMNAYVSSLQTEDMLLHNEDERLDTELRQTNTYVSYNAKAIVHLYDRDYLIYSYAYDGIGMLDERTKEMGDIVSYAYDNIGQLWEANEQLGAYTYESVKRLDEDIASSYDKLYGYISDVVSYAYEGIGNNSYINYVQDITLMDHQNAISAVARNIAYESYVNTIQSGHINTIYYENSTDAFNDWSNPDDDNVEPQN